MDLCAPSAGMTNAWRIKLNITVRDVLATRPCKAWSRDRIVAYFGGRESIPLVGVLRDDGIDIDDRVWIGLQFLADRELRLFACDCADRSLSRVDPDPRSVRAVEVSRRYAVGDATDDELAAAARVAAAWAAAKATNADWAAAAKATNADWAAWAAAAAADWAATVDLDADDAWDAAWVAVVAVDDAPGERRWQIDRIIEYIRNFLLDG